MLRRRAEWRGAPHSFSMGRRLPCCASSSVFSSLMSRLHTPWAHKKLNVMSSASRASEKQAMTQIADSSATLKRI